MAGWKLRKDKAPADTLDPALAADPEAAAPPQQQSAGEAQTANGTHDAPFHDPILLDPLTTLSSFAAAPDTVEADTHFTDLDFDTDPEENDPQAQAAGETEESPLTLIDYSEGETPDEFVFGSPSTIVTMPPNAAMKSSDIAMAPKEYAAPLDYEAPIAPPPLPAYETPPVVHAEPEAVYSAPAPVYEMPPTDYIAPATVSEPSTPEFEPQAEDEDDSAAYAGHAATYEAPETVIAMPQSFSETPAYASYDFSSSDFSSADFSTPIVAPFVLDIPPAEAPAIPPQLVVHFGRLSAAFDLTKDVTTIGRPDSILHYYPDVEIEMDDAVSRRHAEVLRRDGYFYLVDTGSTNGTFLNGEALPPHDERLLAPGDRIRVGDRTEITFEQ